MKLCLVLIVALTGSTFASIEKRILMSTECKKERKYHVEIKTHQKDIRCGGSLINNRWVLTAAHCGERELKVMLGVYDNSIIFSNREEQTVKPDRQFVLKDEEDNLLDIMLIKLNKPASNKLPFLDLPPAGCTRPEVEQEVLIGGKGPTEEQKHKPAKRLMCSRTVITQCGENDKPDSKYHSGDTNTMCAFKVGVKSCYGDSGSGVEYNGRLYGIIVSNPRDKCANPIVMMDICFYKALIEKTMKEKEHL